MKNIIIIILSASIWQTNTAHSYESEAQQSCDRSQTQYVFSWPLSNSCDDTPRGGTSNGAEVTYADQPHEGWLKLGQEGLSSFEKDRLAILAMAGPYRVDFNFLETVGFSEHYERDRPYHSWGTEYVFVIEDQPEFISLQHVMVMYFKTAEGDVSDPMVMKHWRQDWTYEDDTLWVYQGHNNWKKQKVDEQQRAGRWSQAVFQVDDSPRYEAMGQWEHKPGFSTWLSDTTQRPLPRREYSVRNDYHVLEGFNRHTIHRFGWVQEEENWKKVLDGTGRTQTYLAKEEGVGRYHRISGTDFEPGRIYWEQTGPFWADVRNSWQALMAERDELGLNKQVDGVAMFMPLFQYASEVTQMEAYDPVKGRAKAEKIIHRHLR